VNGMRVLVTGASSLIGTGVARALADRGDAVVCFQRRSVDALNGVDGVEQQLGDIRDSEAVTAAATACDAIIHLAARVGVVGTKDDFVSVNVGGTRNVLAAAEHHHIGRVVHVSSPSVAHGGAAIIGAGADEPTTGRSRAWYAESKALSEIEALAASSRTMGVVAVRPHLVWGPGDTQLVGRVVERS
jgi:nucleoside-diphosphate-sugar epimerase